MFPTTLKKKFKQLHLFIQSIHAINTFEGLLVLGLVLKLKELQSLCSHTLNDHTWKAAISKQAASILKCIRQTTLSFPVQES